MPNSDDFECFKKIGFETHWIVINSKAKCYYIKYIANFYLLGICPYQYEQ